MKAAHKTAPWDDVIAKINALRAGYASGRNKKPPHTVESDVATKVENSITGYPAWEDTTWRAAVLPDVSWTTHAIIVEKHHIHPVSREKLLPHHSKITIATSGGEDITLTFDHLSAMVTQDGKKWTVWKNMKTGKYYYWDYHQSRKKIRLHEKVSGSWYKPTPEEYLLLDFEV